MIIYFAVLKLLKIKILDFNYFLVQEQSQYLISERRMSYMLPHLHNGWQVDQAILSEEDKVVVIRFGHDWDPTCMKMDEVRDTAMHTKLHPKHRGVGLAQL
jgi:hypothetical protein